MLLNGRTPDARDAGLISLLHAVDAIPKAVTGDPAQLNARAECLIERAGIDADQTAQAVREAVRAELSAIMISVLVATTAATVTTTTC